MAKAAISGEVPEGGACATSRTVDRRGRPGQGRRKGIDVEALRTERRRAVVLGVAPDSSQTW